MPKPSLAYQNKIDRQGIQEDSSQMKIIAHFDVLYEQIIQKRFLFKRTQKISGVYLFGPVGRGKTMIIDLFLDSLPKNMIYQRYHYHAFMRMIHLELKKVQGIKNPLTMIAKKLKNKMNVLFLDEFFVMDMANAMILGDLLKALFKEKLILSTEDTSLLKYLLALRSSISNEFLQSFLNKNPNADRVIFKILL